MASKTTQDQRLIQMSTPLAKDYLLIERLRCSEGLNQLFHIDLEILHEENVEGFEPTAVDPKALIGNPMVISAHQPGNIERYFHGICVSFSQGQRNQRFSRYFAELRPKVWMLTQNHQSRIFQNKTVPEIIVEILEKGKYDFDDEIVKEGFKPRNYCVQYRESDWDFLSRIMEEEGIFYYFEHKKNEHRLVLGNTPRTHRETPTSAKITYVLERSELKEKWIPSIYEWHQDDKMFTGKYELRDWHFQLPTNPTLQANQTSQFDVGKNKELEVYDWPGCYAKRFDKIEPGGGENDSRLNPIFQDRQRTVDIRQQEMDVAYKMARGIADNCAITAGYKFNFIDHPHKPANGEQVVVSAVHDAMQSPFYISDERVGDPYVVNFTCIPLATPFRPERRTPKPVVHGHQTAIVVGNPGDEIFTDKYGRVKVHFHWDRSDYNDQRASAWIRYGTLFAGNKWGSQCIPRVGHEVIVAFLEGDPDQPIIVGSVYNEQNMPHYELPKFKTLSYLKSHSTPKAQGFNEIRFEDKAKKEQVFVHSQKRYDLRVRGSMYETCGGNRQEVIGYKVKDGDKESGGGNLAITVGGNFDLHVYGDYYIGVEKDTYEVLKGNRTEGIDGYHHSAVKNKVEINSKTITLEASQKITLVVGASCVIVDMMGITIQGPMVKINSGGFGTPIVPAKIAGPIDAEHADTGEPGYLDKPRTGGGGGGRQWGTTNIQHAPVVKRKDDGSYQVGKNIVVKGSDEFVGKTLNALSEINNTKTGQNTLNEIDKGTHTTTIEETTGGNSTTFDNNNDAAAAGKPDLDGNPGSGKGTGSTVKFNPDFEPPTAKDPSVNRPADVGLHHELVHAGHGANATDDNSPDPANPKNPSVEETETINKDNDYRKERGIPPRDDHTKF